MRYNTFDERVEIYDGVSFVGVAGPSAGVNVQEAEDIGILQVFNVWIRKINGNILETQ